jgi:5'(3')-deoxyribonucleotidase
MKKLLFVLLFALGCGNGHNPTYRVDFWANLETTADGLEILNVVERIIGRHNVFICSSPCLTKGCTSGKAAWVDRHLPDGYGQRLLLTGRKEVMADKDRILIDDHDKNVDSFRSTGGEAILVPRPWNSAHATVPHGCMGISDVLNNRGVTCANA